MGSRQNVYIKMLWENCLHLNKKWFCYICLRNLVLHCFPNQFIIWRSLLLNALKIETIISRENKQKRLCHRSKTSPLNPKNQNQYKLCSCTCIIITFSPPFGFSTNSTIGVEQTRKSFSTFACKLNTWLLRRHSQERFCFSRIIGFIEAKVILTCEKTNKKSNGRWNVENIVHYSYFWLIFCGGHKGLHLTNAGASSQAACIFTEFTPERNANWIQLFYTCFVIWIPILNVEHNVT